MERRYRVAVVVALLACAGLGRTATAAPTAASDGAVAPAANATQTQTIQQVQELHRTPDRPGEITVELRYDLPDSLTELEARLPADATVTATDGFSSTDGRYDWDGETEAPSVTYRLPVNETQERTGPLAGEGTYLFADPGPWALVRVPQVGVSWRWRGTADVTLSRETTADGEGVVGEAMAFLGPVETRTRSANGQTFELVVPEAADMAADPDEVFDTVGTAAGQLHVGDRDDRVLMFAAPTDRVQWAVLGLQTGERDLWVRDSEGLSTADNVWLHEYVHTRQDFRTTTETRWLTEASATYYAALLALRQDRISFDQFAARLSLGTRRQATDEVLARPDTWQGSTPYLKGALVAGELDRQVRTTGDSGSFQGVFRAMNAREERVTAAEVREAVGRVGTDETAASYDYLTTTTDTPSMWSSAAHEEAFGTPLARISYAFPSPTNASGYRADGPYRNGSVDGDPLYLATGERLTLPLRVVNDGSAAGTYDARLLVDGIQVARYRGQVAAESTTTVAASHRFQVPGNYTLAVGSARREVRVRDPATPVVTDLTVSPAQVEPGETVTLRATVQNPARVPAVGNLTLTRGETPVERRSLTLAPGERGGLAFERTLTDEGRYRFAVGNRTATVTVRNQTTTGETAVDGPGFGPLVALLAAALAAALLGTRARSR